MLSLKLRYFAFPGNIHSAIDQYQKLPVIICPQSCACIHPIWMRDRRGYVLGKVNIILFMTEEDYAPS